MGTLERRTEQLGILILLLFAYGITVPGGDIGTTVGGILAPFPSAPPLGLASTKNCSWLDGACIVNVGLGPITILAAAITWLVEDIFSLVNRVTLFFSVLITVFFGPQVGVAAIPFMNVLFPIIFILVPGYEFFRMLRGNASAGTL